MPPTEKSATVLCYDPLLSDEPHFSPSQRHELESAGSVTKASSIHLNLPRRNAFHAKEAVPVAPSSIHQRIAIAKTIFLTESAINAAESLGGSQLSTSTLSEIVDMESTLRLMSSETEHIVKADMQNLESKLDALARFCRQQKLVSLPFESVRSAGGTLHLFAALNESLTHVHAVLDSLKSMSSSDLTSQLMLVDSRKAALEFSSALLLKTTLDLAETSMSTSEQRFEELSLELAGLVNSLAIDRA